MNELALFAGAGGGLLATRWFLGWKTVCYVKKARYPVAVIKARIQDGLLDKAPIWDDANTFNGLPWFGRVDIITGGFPCQPFSLAGKRAGEDDPRNGWPATIRIIRQVRPRFLLLENVAALASHPYFRTILGDLAAAGYSGQWGVLSAAAVGAPHLRKRLWIVANSNGHRSETQRLSRQELDAGRGSEIMGDSTSIRQSREVEQSNPQQPAITRASWWDAEPGMGRVAHGVANRVDRIAALGNGQVPAVVRKTWELLKP